MFLFLSVLASGESIPIAPILSDNEVGHNHNLREGVQKLSIQERRPTKIACDQYVYENPEKLEEILSYCENIGKENWKQDAEILEIFLNTLKYFGKNIDGAEKTCEKLEEILQITGEGTVIKLEETNKKISPLYQLNVEYSNHLYHERQEKAHEVSQRMEKIHQSLKVIVGRITRLPWEG